MPLKKIRQFILPYRWLVYGGIACLVVCNFCQMVIPLLVKGVIDDLGAATKSNLVNTIDTGHQLTLMIGAIVVLAVLQGLFRTFSRIWIFFAARKAEHDIRNTLFNHVQRLPLPFYQKTNTGQFMATLTNDLTYMRLMFGVGILFTMNLLISYAFALPAIFAINAKLALMVMLVYPLTYLICRSIIGQIFKTSKKNQQLFGDMTGNLNESFRSILPLKCYSAVDFRMQSFADSADQYLHSSVKLASMRILFSQAMQLANGLGMVLILAYGGLLVANKGMTLGDLVAFSAYLALLSWPTFVMGWVVPSIQRGLAAFSRMQEILDEPTEIDDVPLAASQLSSNEIKFENTAFSYPELTDAKQGQERTNRFVLTDINLTIAPGNRILITGPTASGKTTLLKLLTGLIQPTAGSIALGGKLVGDYTPQDLRSHIGYCPQDAFVFSRTLGENILYAANPQLSIDQASKISALDLDQDQFEDGWQTVVGEQGITLSGGQRQRTALARSVAKGSPVLLLDDPIAQLDSKTAASVWSNLTSTFAETTIILVSQRIIKPNSFDHIVVLDQGQIAEEGSHEELLAMQGIYRHHFMLQQIEGEAA
jgi:ATP-binding cassette subfamily B protein